MHDVALASWRYAYSWLTPEFIVEWVGAAYGRAALDQARAAVHEGTTEFWVAAEGERVVGFAHVGDRGQGLELVRLYVLPSHIAKGIGTGLLWLAEQYVRRKGGNSYFCYVHPANERAMEFYRRKGFFHVPDKDKEKPPLWHMRKDLTLAGLTPPAVGHAALAEDDRR